MLEYIFVFSLALSITFTLYLLFIQNLTNEDLKEIKNQIPLEKIGEPEDIAKCVDWLIQDNYVTGQVISINGG